MKRQFVFGKSGDLNLHKQFDIAFRDGVFKGVISNLCTKKVAFIVLTTILVLFIAIPSNAWASSQPTDSNSNVGNTSSSGASDVINEAYGEEVLVAADLDAAKIEGATFAIDSFIRAEAGSFREINGQAIGYAYYLGSSNSYAVAVVYREKVIVYVPSSAKSLCGIEDPTSIDDLKAYLSVLDKDASKGGVDISSSSDWIFTDQEEFTEAGITYKFCIDAGKDKFYASVSNQDGSDLLQTELPEHVDIFKIVEPGAVEVIPKSTGFAAFVEFLQGIDLSPLWVTLKTTGCAIVFIFVLGLAAAYFTMRIPKRAQDIFDTIFTIPMVLPPTVCGFLLLLLLGNKSPVGQWFIDVGFPLIFSWPATVIAATVVAFPLMYRSCRGAFESLDANMLDAARTLGWSNRRIFLKLMIPLTWSSIAAATVLAFARALGEFGATLFLAGNNVGITQTIPIAIYFEWMGGNGDVAIFWTVIILIISFAVILFINLWTRHNTKYRRRDSDQ